MYKYGVKENERKKNNNNTIGDGLEDADKKKSEPNFVLLKLNKKESKRKE